MIAYHVKLQRRSSIKNKNIRMNLFGKRKKMQRDGPQVSSLPDASTLSEPRTDMDSEHSKNPPEKKLSIRYSSLDELPLKVYVVIVCSGDIRHLGDGTRDELQKTWLNMQDEWDQAIKGDRVAVDTQIYAEIEKLNLDIGRIAILIEYAEMHRHSEDLKQAFAEDGFDFNSMDDLPGIINQSKMLDIQLDMLTKRAEVTLPDSSQPVNKAMFVKCLMRISDFKKYQIRMEDITTLEFCLHYKDFTDYVETVNKKNKGAVL